VNNELKAFVGFLIAVGTLIVAADRVAVASRRLSRTLH
jgi:hypothetical protein